MAHTTLKSASTSVHLHQGNDIQNNVFFVCVLCFTHFILCRHRSEIHFFHFERKEIEKYIGVDSHLVDEVYALFLMGNESH